MKKPIILIFLLLSFFSAFAAHPPQWCEVKAYNTFEICDIYFSSRQDAADWLSENHKPNKPQYKFTDFAIVGAYRGQNQINWYRSGIWFNETYGVWVAEQISGNILPYCPPIEKGRRYNGGYDESAACGGSDISIEGPASTTALPVGPVLPQSATVKIGANPHQDVYVYYKIKRGEEVLSQSGGYTNKNGQVFFNYVPPFFVGGSVAIEATCADCANTAMKVIEVEGLKIDGLDPVPDTEPQMCRR